jgi:predicted TIM-barrel fold metal-dependent hydrolase
VPWIYHEARSRYKTAGRAFPDDVFGAYRIYVTCETHDDFPWVLKYAGEHSLVIGTDYGHLDPSSDTNAILAFQQLEEISQESKERILYHNPKALYNL